jgi:putative hydrolase of the HAD superfamily
MLLNQDSIRVIFFDAAGTLFDVRGSVGALYRDIARRHGVDATADELNASFRFAFKAKTDGTFARHNRLGLEAEKAWWRDLVWSIFGERMDKSTFENYFEDVFDFFRKSTAWVLFDDTRSSLDRLRAAGYRLAVISNFDSRLLDVLADLEIDDKFENVYLSWHFGAAKPDESIFRHALEGMGALPSEALHVGDSIEEDLEGALSVGLRAVLIDRRNRHTCWGRSPRVRSIAELANLLC